MSQIAPATIFYTTPDRLRAIAAEFEAEVDRMKIGRPIPVILRVSEKGTIVFALDQDAYQAEKGRVK